MEHNFSTLKYWFIWRYMIASSEPPGVPPAILLLFVLYHCQFIFLLLCYIILFIYVCILYLCGWWYESCVVCLVYLVCFVILNVLLLVDRNDVVYVGVSVCKYMCNVAPCYYCYLLLKFGWKWSYIAVHYHVYVQLHIVTYLVNSILTVGA